MSYFSVAPTLCEVTYDSNRDDKVTPYRYQCRSANSRATNGITSPSFTEIVNVSLPSGYNVSYYEYLRTLYDSRISSPTKASVGTCNCFEIFFSPTFTTAMHEWVGGCVPVGSNFLNQKSSCNLMNNNFTYMFPGYITIELIMKQVSIIFTW